MTKIFRGLGHLSFRVPNFEDSFAHATQILGLREVTRIGGAAYLTTGEPHHTLELIPSDRAALDHSGPEGPSSLAPEGLRTALEREGVLPLAPAAQAPALAQSI